MSKVESETKEDEKKKTEYDREDVDITPDWIEKPQQQQQMVVKKKTLKDKIRWQYYQTATDIDLSILGIRMIPIDKRSIKVTKTRVVIEIDLQDGDKWTKEFKLCGKIKSHEVTSMKPKINITMQKQIEGYWAGLEKEEVDAKRIVNPSKYPTSSKGDWEKIDSDLKKSKIDEESGTSEFFKKIFKNGTDEQKKAIEKSYRESNGTVLSTNWDQIGKGKVKISPPDGMQIKSYDGYDVEKEKEDLYC